MSFLRNLGRWLVRSLIAVSLVGVGVLAYQWSKYSPRCVIASEAHAIHFSDDGNTLITGYTGTQIGNALHGGDGKPPVKIWDTSSGVVVRSLFSDVKGFNHYAINATRKLVAIDVAQGKIRVGDWQSGSEWDTEVGSGTVQALRFAPKGDTLVVGVEALDQTGVLIDVPARVIVKRLERGARPGFFNTDGSHYYFSLKDRLHVWNCKTREVRRTTRLGEFSQDERLFVGKSDDGALVICDGATLVELARICPALPFQPDIVKKLDPLFRQKIDDSRAHVLSPSGNRIATHALPWGGFNGALEIWETTTGRKLASFAMLQRGWAWFIDDDTLLFFDRSETPLDPVAIANAGPNLIETAVLIDVPSATIRWRRPASIGKLYLPNANTAVHVTSNGTWDILDSVSGESRCSLPHPFAADAFRVSFTEDKRYFFAYGRRRESGVPEFLHEWLKRWVAPESGAVQILDVKNSRIDFAMNFGVNCGATVSKDRRTLVTFDMSWGGGFGRIGLAQPVQPLHHFRFYDLDSNAPWYWALAAPAFLLSVALFWRRWRSRRTKGAAPMSFSAPSR